MKNLITPITQKEIRRRIIEGVEWEEVDSKLLLLGYRIKYKSKLGDELDLHVINDIPSWNFFIEGNYTYIDMDTTNFIHDIFW